MTETDIQEVPDTALKETGTPPDTTYYLESLLNVFAKTIDPNAIITIESVKTGSESELIAGLDSLRKLDFVSEYLIMHIYSNQPIAPRALRLMTYLGEYYSKTPVLEQHYLPEGFVAHSANATPQASTAEPMTATEPETALPSAAESLAAAPVDLVQTASNEAASASTSVSASASSTEVKTDETQLQNFQKSEESEKSEKPEQTYPLQESKAGTESHSTLDITPPLHTAGLVVTLSLAVFFAVWVVLKILSRNPPVHEI
jgi:hypothetical protein